MSRHRRPVERRRPRIAAPDPSVLVRALAVVAFVLSAVCGAMGVGALGVATASRTPDVCLPSAAPWHADPTPMPAAEPVDLTVDRIDACSSLTPVGLDAQRRLEVPSGHTPEQAGWYRLGPTPGERGPAVLVGHVDGDGRRGVFAGLADATAGDRITVGRRDGSTAVFTVTGTVQVSTWSFPARAVYGDTAGAELRLISCGGALEHCGHPDRDTLIVYARLTGQG